MNNTHITQLEAHFPSFPCIPLPKTVRVTRILALLPATLTITHITEASKLFHRYQVICKWPISN